MFALDVRAWGLLACLVLCAGTAGAESGEPGSKDWRIALDGGGVKQFESSLDSGGVFDVDRYFMRFSAIRKFGDGLSAGLSLGYEQNRYDFSGNDGIRGASPWAKIHQSRVSIPVRYRADNNWTFIGIPSLRYAGESGASASDSWRWGLLAAAGYRFSDRLTIGPGFGVFSEIEDSTDFFPILLVDWKISDTVSLSTGRGLAASRGPGVSLSWTPTQRWRLSLDTRYEKNRFRLDENGAVPGGVGQDKSFPLALSATYMPTSDVELSLLGGMELSGKLRLEDADGNRLEQSGYDVAPFAGAFARVRF